MATINPLNVFKGPDSLRNYFNPDEQPPLPLVELPEKLNPFRQDGVRIYAKLLTTLPCQNVKALPALNMLLNDPSASKKSIMEVSSGSTVTSLSIAAKVLYDNDDMTAIVSNKASRDRVRELQFYGCNVLLYGGPTYTDTTDPRGPVEWARNLPKQDPKIVNLGQYDNVHNYLSHYRWTGPQIWKQIPEINIFCMGLGSTGCVTGTGQYLKSQKASVKLVGVCNMEADIIPGPRELPMHATSPFPWKDVVDFTESVSSEASYRLSMKLSREGLIAGPSSGMSLQGLFDFLQREKDKGTLHEYADQSTGDISCVFVTCDLPQKHLDSYFQKLRPEEFPSLINEELFAVDQHVHSFRWEIDPQEAHRQTACFLESIKSLRLSRAPKTLPPANGHINPCHATPIRVIDLRSPNDFETCHVAGAHNLPLTGLTAETKSPFDFDDINVLVDQSKALASMVDSSNGAPWLTEKSPLLVLCYNGDTSRLLTALLRARGFEAYSFRDGMPGLVQYLD